MRVFLIELRVFLGELYVFLGNLPVPHQYLGVLFLDDGVVLILHVHVHAHVGIGRGHEQTLEYALHLGVILRVEVVVDVEHLLAGLRLASLVEDAENLVEAVVHLATKARDLHDDAVVGEAVNEGVGETLGHAVAVVVVGLVAHVKNWLLDVANLVPEDIDAYHGDGVALTAARLYVVRTLVLHAEVLAEA